VLSGIDEIGGGSQIVGDPVIALAAQLNRFAGKNFSLGGGQRHYVNAAFPLASGNLTDQMATAAVLIVFDRYQYAPLTTYSGSKAKWANNGLANAVPFVTANLAEIVTTIAEFGDSLGLEPAAVGITTKSDKFKSAFPVGTVAIVGGLIVAAILVSRRK
jgi:hypothetical protein